MHEQPTPTTDFHQLRQQASCSAVTPVMDLLHELYSILDTIDDAQYTRSPIGPIHASLGGHLRHSLDHIEAFIGALPTGQLDYDARRRGGLIETQRTEAMNQIAELTARLSALAPINTDQPLTLRTIMSAESEPIEVSSSVGRELAFVISHTVHHNALIAAMIRHLGHAVPEHFGYAPSTIAAANSASPPKS